MMSKIEIWKILLKCEEYYRASSTSPYTQLIHCVGSLENAYDLNPPSAVSTSFMTSLVQHVTPEMITRDMIESSEELVAGKWRIVYVQNMSTSFGFGSLLGEITASEVEVGNDGSIKVQQSNAVPIVN
ncbi:hypothetical protein ACHAWF_001501 [Thalassiosira exigua]